MKPQLWLVRTIGVIVPRVLRADWRQEWEAELRYREALLAAALIPSVRAARVEPMTALRCE